METWPTLLTASPYDVAAVAFLLSAWITIGWWIERKTARRPSVTVLMAQYRHDWMRQLVKRDQRIFDAALLQNLRDGSAFFASTSLIALGGGLTLIGSPAPLQDITAPLIGVDATAQTVQIKLLPTIILLTSAFLRFAWANRLFGYFSVLIGAVPAEQGHPLEHHRAKQAAVINTRAAANFNRGLRALYFALASLAWLLGPIALAIASLATVWTLYEREFLSLPRKILAEDPPNAADDAGPTDP